MQPERESRRYVQKGPLLASYVAMYISFCVRLPGFLKRNGIQSDECRWGCVEYKRGALNINRGALNIMGCVEYKHN